MGFDELGARDHLAKVFLLEPEGAGFRLALVHPSYANEQRLGSDNQRLEFLGDAVLQLCSSELLWQRFPDAAEGDLTRLRAQVVSTQALAIWARDNGVPQVLLLGRGADAGGLRDSDNALADAVEALIATSYLEGGLAAASNACRAIVEPALKRFADGGRDPKTELQERAQALGFPPPQYQVFDSGGPPHDPWFSVRAYLVGTPIGEGRGKSKRNAERAAARVGLGHPLLDPAALTAGHESSGSEERFSARPSSSQGLGGSGDE